MSGQDSRNNPSGLQAQWICLHVGLPARFSSEACGVFDESSFHDCLRTAGDGAFLSEVSLGLCVLSLPTSGLNIVLRAVFPVTLGPLGSSHRPLKDAPARCPSGSIMLLLLTRPLSPSCRWASCTRGLDARRKASAAGRVSEDAEGPSPLSWR